MTPGDGASVSTSTPRTMGWRCACPGTACTTPDRETPDHDSPRNMRLHRVRIHRAGGILVRSRPGTPEHRAPGAGLAPLHRVLAAPVVLLHGCLGCACGGRPCRPRLATGTPRLPGVPTGRHADPARHAAGARVYQVLTAPVGGHGAAARRQPTPSAAAADHAPLCWSDSSTRTNRERTSSATGRIASFPVSSSAGTGSMAATTLRPGSSSA